MIIHSDFDEMARIQRGMALTDAHKANLDRIFAESVTISEAFAQTNTMLASIDNSLDRIDVTTFGDRRPRFINSDARLFTAQEMHRMNELDAEDEKETETISTSDIHGAWRNVFNRAPLTHEQISNAVSERKSYDDVRCGK